MINLDNLLQTFAKYAAKKFEGADWEDFLERTGKFDLGDDAAFADLKAWPAGEAGYIRNILSFIKSKFQQLGSTDIERLQNLEKGVPDLMEWALFDTSDQVAQDSFVKFLKQNWDTLPSDWQEGARNFDANQFASISSTQTGPPQQTGAEPSTKSPAKILKPRKLPEPSHALTSTTEALEQKETVMPPTLTADNRKIFIVHGHDDYRKTELDAFLMRATGEHPTILHKQNNRGSSLIEKLERSAASAGYAVILLTADDFGRSKEVTAERPRGRQNVVFEMGYFMAKLGRENVAILLEAGVEEPGDVRGMVYISLGDGNWQKQLANELDEAGYEINWKAI